MGGKGTGQPRWFRCTRCVKEKHALACGFGMTVTLTGKTKKADLRAGNEAGRNSKLSRQYRCNCCLYVGWSKHTDLERAAS